MADDTGQLDGWVDRLDAAAVSSADSSLRRDGAVAPVTVHALSRRRDPAYVGFLICRPVQRGLDAASAVAAMGMFPAVLRADRIMVCWEHAELAEALGVPGSNGLQPALVVLDADQSRHEVRVHPVRLRADPADQAPGSVVVPEWGRSWREVAGELPEPVDRLLRVWRVEQDRSDADVGQVLASFDGAGYATYWIRRDMGH